MAETFQLQLVSPERLLVEEHVTEAQIPARDGYIGVLPGHAPLLSELMAGGVLSFEAGGAKNSFAVFGGFVEVLPDRVRVLADAAERRSEIDLKEARQQLEQAIRLLEPGPGGEASDPAVALDEMLRAQAKVDAATSR